MKRIFILSVFHLLCLFPVFSLNMSMKSDISRLDEAILNCHIFEAEKRQRISELEHESFLADKGGYSDYEINRFLYEEYRSYNYDTALVFVEKMESVLQESFDSARYIDCRLCRAFVFLSGGLFKEAFDILEPMEDMHYDLTDEWYNTYARLLWDMSDYASGELSADYNDRGCLIMEQLVKRHSPADSAAYWLPLATIDLRRTEFKRSITRFEEALKDRSLTEHEKAVIYSSIGFLYRVTGDKELALHYYIDAAICDCRSCTYEAVALRMVAEMLFEQGETELADKYIRIAMADAQRYGARQRLVSISQLLPIIEQTFSDEIHRRTMVAYSLFAIVLLLLILCVVVLFLLIRRNKLIRTARHTIDNVNSNLIVANKVKEELLSSLLVGQSQFLNAVDRYQQHVKKAAMERRYNDLMTIPKAVDAHLQRQILNHRMDELLLSVYPSFVDNFNALLRPEERFVLKTDEQLNTPMRIFALMRLGIIHNEVIAEILDYSVNTIYTYKTRTIARSDMDNDAFYDALMKIPSFKGDMNEQMLS